MKVLELKIRSFRSLKNVTWKPGDLNLIIGPNGSGKSNLLKALETLSAAARGRLAEQITREGGMDSILWDSSTRPMIFGLMYTRKEPDRVRRNWTYEFQLHRLGSTSSYKIAKEELTYLPVNTSVIHDNVVYRREGTEVMLSSTEAIIQPDEDSLTKRRVNIAQSIKLESDVESFLSVAANPITNRPEISEVQKSIYSWGIYYEFQTHHDAQVRKAPVARRDTTVAADGSNLIQVLHTLYSSDSDYKHKIDLAMRAAYGDEFEEIVFPPDADQRIQLRIRWKGLKTAQGASDLSDGTLRFLYLIAILANPNPPPLIAIDEPETGLHPSMLPIIAEYARNASLHFQVILTTHSAEFLDAFTEFDPTVTVAKWVDGQTKLEIRSGESLQYWLKEYTLGKLYRSGELEDLP